MPALASPQESCSFWCFYAQLYYRLPRISASSTGQASCILAVPLTGNSPVVAYMPINTLHNSVVPCVGSGFHTPLEAAHIAMPCSCCWDLCKLFVVYSLQRINVSTCTQLLTFWHSFHAHLEALPAVEQQQSAVYWCSLQAYGRLAVARCAQVAGHAHAVRAGSCIVYLSY
jgi:hypothetical protein